MSEARLQFKVEKLNEEKRLVTAIASVTSKAGGAPITDAQDDIIEIDDLEEAFIEAFADGGIQKGGEMHKRVGGADIVQAFTFSRIEREALAKAGYGVDPDGPEFGIVKFRVNDDALWRRVKSGDLGEVSIAGSANRVQKAYNPSQSRASNGEFGSGAGSSRGSGKSLAPTKEGAAAETANSGPEHRSASGYHATKEKTLRNAGNSAAADAHDAAVKAHLDATDATGTPAFDRLSAKANIASDRAHSLEAGEGG